MANSTIKIKRGDTLPLSGLVTVRDDAGVDVSAETDFSLWNISAEVRTAPSFTGSLLAAATIDFIGDTNEFYGVISATLTDAFPDVCYMDLRFRDAADVIQSTRSLRLEVEDAVSTAPA